MLHQIPISSLGPTGQAMTDAVQTCVHCGFCLPACPTYRVLGEEQNSPRGRIILMKEVLEGRLEPEQVQPHIDKCLGCLACETACPSGVPYHQLISPYRQRTREQRRRRDGLLVRLRHWMAMTTLPYPRRFRLAARMGRLARPLLPITPRALRPMLELVPDALPKAAPLPERAPAVGTRRARVALLAGCAQQVLDPDIGHATIRVLARHGVEVVVPRGQGCCGSLAWHVGDGDRARAAARINLAAFPDDVDAIVTNAAGCGSGMSEYGLVFRGDADEDRATRFARKVIDAAQFLDKLGLADAPPPTAAPVKIAYHDACHLSHAQRVRSAPRRLLASIPGVEVVEIADGDICCGSAGTYNMDEPIIAAKLGEEKATNVRATGCDLVAMGNIGCMVQIRTHLSKIAGDSAPPVLHTMQVMDRAYRGMPLRNSATRSPAGRG